MTAVTQQTGSYDDVLRFLAQHCKMSLSTVSHSLLKLGYVALNSDICLFVSGNPEKGYTIAAKVGQDANTNAPLSGHSFPDQSVRIASTPTVPTENGMPNCKLEIMDDRCFHDAENLELERINAEVLSEKLRETVEQVCKLYTHASCAEDQALYRKMFLNALEEQQNNNQHMALILQKLRALQAGSGAVSLSTCLDQSTCSSGSECSTQSDKPSHSSGEASLSSCLDQSVFSFMSESSARSENLSGSVPSETSSLGTTEWHMLESHLDFEATRKNVWQ